MLLDLARVLAVLLVIAVEALLLVVLCIPRPVNATFTVASHRVFNTLLVIAILLVAVGGDTLIHAMARLAR